MLGGRICEGIKDSLLMLAVVFFCQIYNSGFKSEGKAAGNNKAFVAKYFSQISNKVFPTAIEQERFNLFCDQLISARDKMIGHADGDAFNITHGTPTTSMKHYAAAIREIDTEYWASILKPIQLGVLDCANQERDIPSAGTELLEMVS